MTALHDAPFPVLYADNHLLAVVKPAGVATMAAEADVPDLLAMMRQYLKRSLHKPGNVYLSVLSRLDVPVSGVLVLARTSKAAARLAEQFRERTAQKTYWAVVEGIVDPPSATCVDWIVEDSRHRKVHRTQSTTEGARECRLTYRRLAVHGERSWLEIQLETGRKHQIRVQLAARKHPILGDRKYGATASFPAGIALHARRLVIDHPTRHEPLCLEAPLPGSWRSLGLEIEEAVRAAASQEILDNRSLPPAQ